jgi:hypothetical protein
LACEKQLEPQDLSPTFPLTHPTVSLLTSQKMAETTSEVLHSFRDLRVSESAFHDLCFFEMKSSSHKNHCFKVKIQGHLAHLQNHETSWLFLLHRQKKDKTKAWGNYRNLGCHSGPQGNITIPAVTGARFGGHRAGKSAARAQLGVSL